MEFKGRIERVLPSRSGVSTRTGNEWKAVPFVFEYFEHDGQRYSDKVLLETYDSNMIAWIDQHIKIEENGKIVITKEMECRCGFGHSIREWDGKVYNEVRMYKMELIGGIEQPAQAAQPAGDAAGTGAETQQGGSFDELMKHDAVAAQAKMIGEFQEHGTGGDDLPF